MEMFLKSSVSQKNFLNIFFNFLYEPVSGCNRDVGLKWFNVLGLCLSVSLGALQS